MPRKPRKNPVKTPSETPSETPYETPYDPDEQDEGVTVFDSTGEDKYVRVKRLNERTKKWDFLFRLAPHEATEEYIQELAGGGTFRCIEMVVVDGSPQFGRQRTLVIGGEPKKVVTVPDGAGRTGTPTVTPTPTSVVQGMDGGVNVGQIMAAGLLDFFKASQVANQAAVQAIKEIGSSRREERSFWTPEVVIAMAALAEKVLNRPQKELDLLGVIEQVTNMVRSNTNPSASFKDTIEVMNEVLDLKERTRPEEGDPLTSLIGENASKLIDIIATATREKGRAPTEQEVRAVAARTVQGQLPPAIPAQQSPQGEQAVIPENAPVWQRVVATYEKQLVRLAQTDKDPVVLANFALQMLSPPARAGMREFLAYGEDSLTALFGQFPALAQQRAWVTEFFSAMYEHFFGGSDEEETEEGSDNEDESGDENDIVDITEPDTGEEGDEDARADDRGSSVSPGEGSQRHRDRGFLGWGKRGSQS